MLPRPPDKNHKRTRQPFKAHRPLWNRAGYGQRSAVATVVLPRLRGDVLHLPFLLSGGRSTAGMSAAAGCGANRGGGPTAATSRTRRFGPIIANASGNTGNDATGEAGIFASLPFYPMFSGVPNGPLRLSPPQVHAAVHNSGSTKIVSTILPSKFRHSEQYSWACRTGYPLCGVCVPSVDDPLEVCGMTSHSG